MLGYNDNPEATAAAIDAEGWLHTGDLGTMDERGYLAITGRVKEMIIRGGENLFPAEIENVDARTRRDRRVRRRRNPRRHVG
jgi:fatty-acyl-CoA synthase